MHVQQGFTVGPATGYDEAVAFAAERGFDFVELGMNHDFARRRVDPDRIARIADDHGVDLAVHLPYRVDPGSPHERAREGACRELEAAIDAAAAFGAGTAVLHAVTQDHEGWRDEVLWGGVRDSVRRLTDYGRDRDVEVAVENLMDSGFEFDSFPALFEETDALACLDTGHAHVTGADTTAQADLLREHCDRIAHVHFNDTRYDHDDEHLPVGLGKLDFEPIARAMRETDWTGTCTHEVFAFGLTYVDHGKAAFDRLLEGDGPPEAA